MKPTLIIDADDTLWENNIYYEQCIAAFVELMVARGFEQEGAERTVEMVEREQSEAKRYGEIHGIDIADLSIYDLVLDTEKCPAAQVAKAIFARLQEE